MLLHHVAVIKWPVENVDEMTADPWQSMNPTKASMHLLFPDELPEHLDSYQSSLLIQLVVVAAEAAAVDIEERFEGHRRHQLHLHHHHLLDQSGRIVHRNWLIHSVPWQSKWLLPN